MRDDLVSRVEGSMVIGNSGGRLVLNGWATGVGMAGAIVRAGTFLAASDGPVSLGTVAMERFLRPVGHQNPLHVLLQEAFLDSAYRVTIPQSGESQ